MAETEISTARWRPEAYFTRGNSARAFFTRFSSSLQKM
jgi:hypothetical protein